MLGQGALETVDTAIDSNLGHNVAIKTMVANPNNPDFSGRFTRGAAAMAKLYTPHIATIFDYGSVSKLHYLAME